MCRRRSGEEEEANASASTLRSSLPPCRCIWSKTSYRSMLGPVYFRQNWTWEPQRRRRRRKKERKKEEAAASNSTLCSLEEAQRPSGTYLLCVSIQAQSSTNRKYRTFWTNISFLGIEWIIWQSFYFFSLSVIHLISYEWTIKDFCTVSC